MNPSIDLSFVVIYILLQKSVAISIFEDIKKSNSNSNIMSNFKQLYFN